MRSALYKDLAREIQRSSGRFLSIFAIIFIGVAFFAGVKATAPNMKYSMDQYYDEYNLMDIRIMSTLGLTQDDIEAICSIEGIEDVQGGYFTDVVTTIDSTETVLRVHSLSFESIFYGGSEYINQIRLTEGRYPQKSGECIIEDSDVVNLGLSVGDVIRVGSGKPDPITEDTLATDTFTIVGKAVTPYYLSYDKGASEIGSGWVASFMLIMDYDFIIPVYTEALATVVNAKQLNSYSHEYEELISKVSVRLENLGYDRSGLRLEELKRLAYDELEKASREYDEIKRQFEDEIRSAEEELNAAQVALVEGEATLQAERENFEQNYETGMARIKEGEEQIDSAQEEYDAALLEYNQTMQQYGDELEDFNSTVDEINLRRTEAQALIDELKALMDSGSLTAEQQEITEQLIEYYDEYLDVADESIASINGINALIREQISNAETRLNSAKEELDRQEADLKAAKRRLINGKADAEAGFSQAEADLASGWQEYNMAKEEFDSQKTEGEEKLEAGYQDIIHAENEIEKLSKPQWYVLDRNSHYSFVDYGKTADRIDAIARVFPVFFFLVASLVCLTTMTRMVDEQRGNIGIYKALGYENSKIAVKYMVYAASASLCGGVAGLFAGLWIFPEVIYKSWAMKYTLPPMLPVVQAPLMILSVVTGVAVTTLSAYIACNRDLKENPSALIRPKAPKTGRKIFLERIRAVWCRLTFSQKVTVRNLFRYKKRFFMTITGIIGCTSLLLGGFGLSDSIGRLVDKQYNDIFSFDMNMRFTVNTAAQDRQRIMDQLDANPNVQSYLPCAQIHAAARNKEDDIAVELIIPDGVNSLEGYIDLRERVSRNPIDLSVKGIIITEKLSKELGAALGDSIELGNGDGARKKVQIAAITENYIFHYAYMSQDYYNEIFRIKPAVNSLLIKHNLADRKYESELGGALISDSCVASIEYYSAAAENFGDTVKILNSIVIVIIISAGLLAVVVLYNLTNINISERTRELATIKVLGFYNSELTSYIYRENTIIAVMGSCVGLAVGIALHRFIMVSLEQDGIMFGNYIDPVSFLYAFCMTMAFAFLVNIFMYKKITGIPMVESLKSVE